MTASTEKCESSFGKIDWIALTRLGSGALSCGASTRITIVERPEKSNDAELVVAVPEFCQFHVFIQIKYGLKLKSQDSLQKKLYETPHMVV
jgi:hypothetical protein